MHVRPHRYAKWGNVSSMHNTPKFRTKLDHCYPSKRKDKSWRFCGDYKALNGVTMLEKYSIAVVNELQDKLHEALCIF